MTGVVTKLKIGTAVVAGIAVAGLTPVIAQAEPDDTPGTGSASVGTSAGKAPTRSGRSNKPKAAAPSSNLSPSTDPAPSTDPSADATASATGSNPLIQNPLIWVGQPNPAPPPGTTIYEFEPLADLPEFSRPMFGWMKDFEFEACVLGLSSVSRGQNVVGPYGTSTTGFSSSGC